MKHICQLIAGFAWICGVVIAKGFWSTILAFAVPPWAWYLLAEKLIILFL